MCVAFTSRSLSLVLFFPHVSVGQCTVSQRPMVRRAPEPGETIRESTCPTQVAVSAEVGKGLCSWLVHARRQQQQETKHKREEKSDKPLTLPEP